MDPNDATCRLCPGNYFSFFLVFFFILFTALYRFMYQRKWQMLPPPRHHIRMDGLWAVSTMVAIGTTMLRDDGRMRGVTRGTPKRRRATYLGHVVCSFLSFLFILLTFFRYNALIFQQPPQPNNKRPTQPNVEGCDEDEQRGDEQRQWGA